MVSQKTIQGYDFTTIEEYFAYIVESKINGQHAQVEDLITKLSKDQKKDFLQYLESNGLGEDARYCKEKTLELL